MLVNFEYENHKPANIKKILDTNDPKIFSSPKKLETLLSITSYPIIFSPNKNWKKESQKRTKIIVPSIKKKNFFDFWSYVKIKNIIKGKAINLMYKNEDLREMRISSEKIDKQTI